MALPVWYTGRLWKRFARLYDPLRCADFASPAEGDQVLDVCCGTGTLTSLIAARVGPAGQAIGVDISESALEIARTKTCNIPVAFVRASAEALPFASSRFDKCFISFGLHGMPEQARQNTIREIARTLRTSGSLFVVDYNLPAKALARLTLKAFVKHIEDEAAYRMLVGSSLEREIVEIGFAIRRRHIACSGMVQLIEAVNP